MDWFSHAVLSACAPDVLKRLAQEKEERQKRFKYLQASRKPEPWHEFRTKFAEQVYLDAKTWRPVSLFPGIPPLHGQEGENMSAEGQKALRWSPDRRFMYYEHVLDTGTRLALYNSRRQHGELFFSGPVLLPTLAEKCEDDPDPKTWMSYTPNEVMTQRGGVRIACGRVVVGGLGLGWLLNAICSKPSVTEVVLVEHEQVLHDWLWPKIQAAYPAVAAKTTFEVSDVYDFMKADHAAGRSSNTRYVLDIWERFNETDRRFEEWRKIMPTSQLWGWGMLADS